MVSIPTPGLQYNPDNTTKPSPKISVGRQTSLSFMLGFNYSDWTSGWMSAFDGYTVFYSEPADKTLDPVYSIALSSDSGEKVNLELNLLYVKFLLFPSNRQWQNYLASLTTVTVLMRKRYWSCLRSKVEFKPSAQIPTQVLCQVYQTSLSRWMLVRNHRQKVWLPCGFLPP